MTKIWVRPALLELWRPVPPSTVCLNGTLNINSLGRKDRSNSIMQPGGGQGGEGSWDGVTNSLPSFNEIARENKTPWKSKNSTSFFRHQPSKPTFCA
eukprot:75106-Karenia_brevis.AAC.1